MITSDAIIRAAAELLEEPGFQTPAYILDLDGIRTAAMSYRNVWTESFPGASFAYSYKTNCNTAVTAALLELGYEAEVTNFSEWTWALADGIGAPGIVVNGPVKGEGFLRAAIAGGALIQIDSLAELDRLLAAAHAISSPPRVGVRLSHPLPGGRQSRFGLSSEEAETAVSTLMDNRIELASIHLHTSNASSPGGRALAICQHQDFIRDRLSADRALVLNVGGGDHPFIDNGASRARLRSEVTMLLQLLQALGINTNSLNLLVEPGRALTEAHGVLLARTAGRKSVGAQTIVVCDARSECLRPRAEGWRRPAALFDHVSQTLLEPASEAGLTKIVGSHCYERDILAEIVVPNSMATASAILFAMAGAYDLASCGSWSGPRPSQFVTDRTSVKSIAWREHPAGPELPGQSASRPVDRVFEDCGKPVQPFEFSEEVAGVFDNMIGRSIPLYDELQRLLARLALEWASGHPIIDIGCSTGTTFAAIIDAADEPQTLVGIDTSQPMLRQASAKLAEAGEGHRIHFHCASADDFDLCRYGRPGAIIMNLVAQFIRPPDRSRAISRVYEAIRPGGAFLFVEKTIDSDPDVAANFIAEYHRRKRLWGYSDEEIQRKREALENQLVPFRPEENLQMLKSAGFDVTSVFFTWLNFQGYLGIKK